MPCGPDMAVGVTGFEQADQLGPAPIFEALVGSGQQTAGPIQRVGLSSAMAEGLVLHPAPVFVEALIRHADDVEGVATWMASGSMSSKTAL